MFGLNRTENAPEAVEEGNNYTGPIDIETTDGKPPFVGAPDDPRNNVPAAPEEASEQCTPEQPNIAHRFAHFAPEFEERMADLLIKFQDEAKQLVAELVRKVHGGE